MRTYSIYFSRLSGAIALGALLSFGLSYTSTANAAQGCGKGYHVDGNGRCVLNAPGANATPVTGRPNCWRNANGALRCSR